MTKAAITRAQVAAMGWCVACADGGDQIPAVGGTSACQTHLRLMPRRAVVAGQLALAVEVPAIPPALRAPYATGVQQWCADCVARGAPVPRMGMPERTAGDPIPVCWTCWRSRSRTGRPGLTRRASWQTAAWIADLPAGPVCEGCGDAAGGAGCWRCGDRARLVAAARQVQAEDQAVAARDAERVEELRALHKLELARAGRAVRRLETVVVWQEQLSQVVDALPRLASSGGRLRVSRVMGRYARAWYLLADFLARDAAARQASGHSGLGRPQVLPLVVAVMAVAASRESGRGSMAGKDWTAVYAGVSARSVSAGWARAAELECVELVARGRILTVEEREELQRHRQRAVFDFTPLDRSPVSPADLQSHLGIAAQLLVQLFARAGTLVEEFQAAVDAQQAAAVAVEAELLDLQAWIAERTAADLALQAAVDMAPATDAVQAAERARAARARASWAAVPPPADPREHLAARCAAQAGRIAAEKTLSEAAEQARRLATFCTHPRSGQAGRFSSGSYWGLTYSPRSTSHTPGERPDGRGEDQKHGASRSPTKSGTGLTAPQRPRTIKRVGASSPGQADRTAAMRWAKPLAAALSMRWPFLARFLAEGDGESLRAVARERGRRLRMIADTLVPRLAPQRPGGRVWAADEVVCLVERYAGVISVIAPGDAYAPLSYLAKMLDRALTNPAAHVPVHSPVRARYERDVLAVQRAAEAAHAAAHRDAQKTAATAAATERAGAQTGRAAARAAAGLACGPAPVRRPLLGRPADEARMAQARAEITARHAVPPAAEEAWPTPRQPGSGLPR